MDDDPPLTAIVLAGGGSRRMGPANKLLLEVGGTPVLARVLRAFLGASAVAEVVVVTGFEQARVAEVAAAQGPVRLAHNQAFRSGMASSIRCGVRAARSQAAGYAICPGDLPLLTAGLVCRLCRAFSAHPPPRIVRPVCAGRAGHPVLFDSAFRPALLALWGDRGARAVLQRHDEAVVRVPVETEGGLRDVDTPEAYEQVRQNAAPDS